MTAEIPLTQGKVALVDEADLPILSHFKWCVYTTPTRTRTLYYALAHIPGSGPQAVGRR